MSDKPDAPNAPSDPTPPDPTDTPAVQEARQQVGSVATAFQTMSAFLSAIVVIERYEIYDLLGNAYKFKPVLSTRRQMATSLRLDRFLRAYGGEEEVLDEARESMARSGLRAGLMHFLSVVLENEDAQQAVQEMFRGIHPRLLKQAQAAAQAAWAEGTHEAVELWQDDGHEQAPTHVLDLFELDALLEALVPFFARSATRIGQALGRMAGPARTTRSAKRPPTSSRPNLSPPSGS